MSSCPSHTIYPSAKLTAENTGLLELSAHRCAVASAMVSAALTHRGTTVAMSTPASSTPPNISSPLPLLPDLQSQVDKTCAPMHRSSGLAPQTSGKRLAHNTSPTRVPMPAMSIDDINDGMPIAKKAKKAVKPLDTLNSLGMHSDVQVMGIDDIADPRQESLNKSDPTADIKFFFTSVPSPPGQTKLRMWCNLCM